MSLFNKNGDFTSKINEAFKTVMAYAEMIESYPVKDRIMTEMLIPEITKSIDDTYPSRADVDSSAISALSTLVGGDMLEKELISIFERSAANNASPTYSSIDACARPTTQQELFANNNLNNFIGLIKCVNCLGYYSLNEYGNNLNHVLENNLCYHCRKSAK